MLIKVLDKGFVRLDAHCADDLSVVNSARVSFHKRSDSLSESEEKLIGFLMKNRHGTPFEHNFFRFHIKAPIFVFREWHRHRIGVSVNEWSARYSELSGEFYIPSEGCVRSQIGKPGRYSFVPASKRTEEHFISVLQQHSERSYALYQEALFSGVAKEQARFLLPVNIYSEMYWSCNARSLMNFLSLRNADNAMWEIRQYALALEEIFTSVMPVTAKFFIECGRKAP